MATSYQTRPEGSTNPVLRMPLKGAQEGLVLTIMSQDCIVHWPGSIPKDSGTQLVNKQQQQISLLEDSRSS